jgi:hypothetical protein
VKFKYEKLGIFCFLCGIMGHAENRCEVRYSMEQDDGSRGWTADIRAEPRRQGGRLHSRWLREERGGREELGGGAREARSNFPESSQGSGPTRADVAGLVQSNFIPYTTCQQHVGRQVFNNFNDSGPTPQNQTVPLPIITTPSFSKTLTTQIAPLKQKPSQITLNSQPFIQPVVTTPIIKAADIKFNPLTHIYSPSLNNNDIPKILSQTLTVSNNNKSLPNHSMIFNSQPSQQGPPHATPTNHKNPRGPAKHNPATRTNKSAQPEPSVTQPRPDKKPKSSNPVFDPNQNPIPGTLSQKDAQDMEIQGEKKRRREEEVSSVGKNSEGIDHFLTAGPGRQDCRDQ